MYILTLTKSERDAIDWVGGRYANGNQLRVLLDNFSGMIGLAESPEWNDKDELTFEILEPIAWQIRDIAAEDGYSWPCFSPEFKQKMQQFVDSIV